MLKQIHSIFFTFISFPFFLFGKGSLSYNEKNSRFQRGRNRKKVNLGKERLK